MVIAVVKTHRLFIAHILLLLYQQLCVCTRVYFCSTWYVYPKPVLKSIYNSVFYQMFFYRTIFDHRLVCRSSVKSQWKHFKQAQLNATVFAMPHCTSLHKQEERMENSYPS